MSYITTHSTHFIYGYIVSSYIVKDHCIQMAREETTWATLFNYQQGIFCIQHPTDRIAQVVEHWMERKKAQWDHHEGSIRRHEATSRFPKQMCAITPWSECVRQTKYPIQFKFVCISTHPVTMPPPPPPHSHHGPPTI